jgi:hypothetical protein
MPPFPLAVQHPTNWTNVAVIISSIIVSAGIVITWITRVNEHQEQRRTEETREIVLEALTTHMQNEERQRAKDARQSRKWRKKISRELADLREETTRGYERRAPAQSPVPHATLSR